MVCRFHPGGVNWREACIERNKISGAQSMCTSFFIQLMYIVHRILNLQFRIITIASKYLLRADEFSVLAKGSTILAAGFSLQRKKKIIVGVYVKHFVYYFFGNLMS